MLFLLFKSYNFIGQEQLDCEYNTKEALEYIKYYQNFSKDSSKVVELLKPCVNKGFSKAQHLLGRLYLVKGLEETNKKAFKLIKKAAKSENIEAMSDLGMLFKYGYGCNLNFDKAKKWYKKAADLGNYKAAYSLGYLYLKGLGDVEQNYSKAIEWFEKSEYPMAKYWLGHCYYFGYGVQKNIAKANELLGTNFEIIENESLNEEDIFDTNISDFDISNTNTIEESNNDEETISSLTGDWKGFLLKLDWSGKFIEQKHQMNFNVNIDSINEAKMIQINVNDTVIKEELQLLENNIYFENTNINLPHTTFNNSIPNEINYQLVSSNFKMLNLNGIDYLVGNFDSYINDWNEIGAPLKFVLRKKESFENTSDEISEDILNALATQANKFIKLYPNPFESDLIISYTLNEPSFVQVQIADLYGGNKQIIENGKTQNKGKYSYFFNGLELDKGIYIVTVIVNNKINSSIIVKK